MKSKHERVTIAEGLGLLNLGVALSDLRKNITGSKGIPSTMFDHTSFRIFKPRISLPTWLGIKRKDRLVPVYNFFNREQKPKDEGWSVRVTYARDYMGGRWTYDGHEGVDLAIPIGTRIVAPAPGKILKVCNDLDLGALKVFMDHGQGVMTLYDHLARAVVEVGDTVARGQTIALSGASGLGTVLFFPWLSPHVHFKVWLNGQPVDPFAMEQRGEVSMWLKSNHSPAPCSAPGDTDFEPTQWNEELVNGAIEECTDAAEKRFLYSFENIEHRAVEAIVSMHYKPLLYASFPNIYDREYERRPLFDLPLSHEDYNGILSPYS